MNNLRKESKLSKIGKKIKEKATWLKCVAYGGLVSAQLAMANPMSVYADDAFGVGDGTKGETAGNIVKTSIDTIINIFPLIGGFFVVSGVFKLIMAYRNDQPEAQTAAAKDIVIGAVFVAFRVIWSPVSTVLFPVTKE